MTYQEWFWLYDIKRTDKPKHFGLSEDELADLYELISPKTDG